MIRRRSSIKERPASSGSWGSISNNSHHSQSSEKIVIKSPSDASQQQQQQQRHGFCKSHAVVFITALNIVLYFVVNITNNINNLSSRDTSSHFLVVPFSAYKVDNATGDTHHRSCRKTIIVHGKVKWPDQPFEELLMGDISVFPSIGEDLLCLQVGSSVGALVTSNKPAAPIIIGSDAAEEIINRLKKDMAIEESADVEVKVVDRKTIAMHGWYQPSTPATRLARSSDQNVGNFIWQFGATRLINPYTTNFVTPEDAILKSIDVDALVLASANALHLPEDGHNFQVMKNHINQLSHLVERINKPTVLLGIGIQAKFSDVEDTKHIALHEHQAHLMTEIAKRNSLEKSVSVRGTFTETACINAGVHNCISLGCPR